MTQWNESQLAAIGAAGTDVCVDAAAGSGKTSVLVERIVHLLENKLATLDDIVGITFTDAAASEMRERLRAKCREMQTIADSQIMTFWRTIARRIETARIGTIHGFCAGMLRENALSVGLDPDFTVLAEAEAALLRHEAVSGSLFRALQDGDAAASRAVAALGTRQLSDLLTKLLARRRLMAGLDADHAHDPARLLETWHERARAAWLDDMADLKNTPTFRRLARRLSSFDGRCCDANDGREELRRRMLEAMHRIETVSEDSAFRGALLELTQRVPGRGQRKNWSPPEVFDEIAAVQRDVAAFAKGLVPAEVEPRQEADAAQSACDLHAVYGRARDAYQQEKAARAALDFDDLISLCLAMLRTEDVGLRVSRRIRYLLVDEFQDTDSEQYEIVQLLKHRAPDLELFIVGDAKQSIYGFRGAEVEVFGKARAGRALVSLDRNYRTAPEVLACVNDFFHRTDLLAVVEPVYHPMQAHRNPANECRIEFLVPESGDGISRKDYRDAEAELIAACIVEMCGGTDRAQIEGREGLRPAGFGDVAMLFRRFSNLHVYERSLRQRGIPYQVIAGAGFYERQEIVDLVNLLRLVVNPFEEMTLLGFLRGPFGGLSDESLVRLCHDGSLLSAFHGGLVPQDFESSQADALVAARTLLADLRSRTELPLPAFLRYAIERTGCEAIALSQFLGVRKARNVRKLIDLADGFSRTRAPRLERFVQYVEEVGSMDVREGDAALEAGGAEAVTLMTIHKAKGLEFPIVVVPDVSSELRGPDPLPIAVDRDLGLAASTEDEFGSRVKPPLYELITRRHRDNARAESARLLYVAMTRARDWLLLSGAPLSRGDSWQAHFDEQYGLLKRADGDQIAGTGWSATVRRTAPPDPRTAPRKEPRDVLEEDLVRKRLAEVCVHRDPARPFTVTEVAAKMASMGNDFPAPDPRSLDTPTPVQDDKPAADPRRRGTLLHRVLQQWDFHSDVGPVVDRILRSSAPSLAARRGDEDYLNQRAAVFRSSSIGKRVADEVLEGTAHREQPFTLRLGGALVSGMMDIVLADGTIIDYKTGTGPPHRRVEYEWQIRLYAAALGTLRNRDVPAAHLCYVDGDEIHGVDVSTERLDETVRLAHEAIRALQHQENA